jgi:hypothetical protein
VKTRSIAVCLLVAASFVFSSDKGFNPPPAGAAVTYPAHEAHDNEKVTIAVDPFTTSEKAAVFKIKYKDYGFLPVRLIITNDGDKPLMLQDLTVQLITAAREKLEPATQDDIFRRMSRPEKAASRPKVQLPIPVPHDKNPISKDARDEVPLALFNPMPVTPHSTYSGFLFFDILGINGAENGAHLYISGIKSGTQELFYFDIPLQADSAPHASK